MTRLQYRTEKLEARIRNAVDAVRKRGLRIVDQRYGSVEAGACCPMTAVVISEGITIDINSDPPDLLVCRDEYGFIDGFDGMEQQPYHRAELYALGKKLRAEWIEVGEIGKGRQ